MSFNPSMNVANLTCRFGDQKVLLDLFSEVVYPAFFESKPRIYRNNEFYFFDLLFANAGDDKNPEPIISGQFVRNTDLKRSHILRETILIEDSDHIESATSAKFVLVLSSHTLIYVSETPHAPPIHMFRSTLQFHLTKAWGNFLKNEAKRRYKLQIANKAYTKKPKIRDIGLNLLEEFPRPELEITQLPSRLSIKDFLAQFESISKVEYQIQNTNHSPDLTKLLKQLRVEKNATESQSIIVIENKPKNKKALEEQLGDATIDGNVKATVNGKAVNGGKLKGSNDMFSLTIPFIGVSQKTAAFTKHALKKFYELINAKEITIHKIKDSGIAKLKAATPTVTLDDKSN